MDKNKICTLTVIEACDVEEYCGMNGVRVFYMKSDDVIDVTTRKVVRRYSESDGGLFDTFDESSVSAEVNDTELETLDDKLAHCL